MGTILGEYEGGDMHQEPQQEDSPEILEIGEKDLCVPSSADPVSSLPPRCRA